MVKRNSISIVLLRGMRVHFLMKLDVDCFVDECGESSSSELSPISRYQIG